MPDDPTPIGESLAKSLVEALGPDCATAAVISRIAIACPGDVLDLVRLKSAPAGALDRVLRDFVRRGWLVAQGGGAWAAGSNAIPREIPAFLEGAAAMRAIHGAGWRESAITRWIADPVAYRDPDLAG